MASLFQILAGVAQAFGQVAAGEAEEIELKQQAEQEKLAGETRELQRRQKLNRVLAQNVVGQAASGISGEGTPEAIALGSAKQASLTEGIEGLSTRLRQAQLIRRGKSAKQAGRIAAASTLLKTAADAEESSGSGGGK